jgi:hypothetical protein
MGDVDRAVPLVLGDRPGDVRGIGVDDTERAGDQPCQRRRIDVVDNQAAPVLGPAAVIGRIDPLEPAEQARNTRSSPYAGGVIHVPRVTR